MMKRLLKSATITTLVFLLFFSHANAGEWTEIFYSNDGGVFYAQKNTPQQNDLNTNDKTQPEGWFKLVPPRRLAEFAYMLALYRVDCNERTLVALSASLYQKNGTLIEADGIDGVATPVPIEPGTGAEAVYLHLCGHY